MCVCENGWMDGWIDGCENGWMDGWIHVCMYLCEYSYTVNVNVRACHNRPGRSSLAIYGWYNQRPVQPKYDKEYRHGQSNTDMCLIKEGV